MAEDYTKKLQSLLRKLFQFESADLDFGIYRIMNKKRDVIEKFIEKDLIAAVDAEFGKISEVTKDTAQKEIDDLKMKIQETLGSSALLPSGDFNPKFIDTPIGADLAQQLKEKTTRYTSVLASNEHKSEVFNHIYQFFSRYYDNGDFMSMRRYSAKQKFAVPYNGEEVLLHWANKDQYYIKTGEYFFNYAFRVGEYTVRFQIVQADTSVNNTKAENRFFILRSGDGNVSYDAKAKELVVLFEYRALIKSEEESLGTRNKQDALNEQATTAILAGVPDPGLKAGLTRETEGKIPLAKHLATYAKRNTTDYFIHKDLTGFLTQELDFYIKNEMFDLDDLGSEKEVPIEQYLNRVRVMKAISLKIIAFLAQIEDFQKKLFEKKKFVMKSEYCMTLDRVPEEFYSEIVKNAAQIAEWKTLYSVGESREQTTLSGSNGNVIDEDFLKSHPYLVLDTNFFPQEFKDLLLSTFDDLDEATGGLMVKSENWQALNLLQERYREQVKCIYIDPPYNTGSDEFLYKDNYQHSSWISMIGDRVEEARKLLGTDSSIFISVDDVELCRLIELENQIFGSENFIATCIWQKNYAPKSSAMHFSGDHEYLTIFATNSKKWSPSLLPRTEEQDAIYKNVDNDPRGRWRSNNLAARNYYSKGLYSIKCPGGRLIQGPPQGSYWRVSWEKFQELDKDNRIWWGEDGNNVPSIKIFLTEVKEGRVPQTLWFYKDVGHTQEAKREILSFLHLSDPTQVFSTPRPVRLLDRILRIGTNNEKYENVLDFFAGSGTTGHAVLNLNRHDNGNRKFVLVEMADYFDKIMKPRIQKVMYSSEWKDGKPQNTDGISHIFKYLILEQYEDTLNNIEFQDTGTIQKTLMDMDGYFLRYMLDFETRESPCRMNVAKLERPFNYRLRITRDSELHDETVDLVETFNYLLGLKVKRIWTFAENGTTYRIVHGETLASEPTTIVWRTTTGLDLKKDKEFIEGALLKDPKFKAERVFINSDFHVEGALPIEPEFQRLMGA